MFEGFQHRRRPAGDSEIDLVTGGDGPPLLLLHGYPQTRACWHAVAPALSKTFRLVIPDLPGYGASEGPAPDAENLAYSKRNTARTMVALMAALGHERFLLAGHDRGGRVAYRLALDHPERVDRLALLDIVPTLAVWQEMDWQVALGAFHWLYLAQPAPLPEKMIGRDPDLFIDHLLDRWAQHRDALDPDAVEDYRRAFRRPSVIAATCADYRAGATTDVEHDRDDRSTGKRITCPTQVLWGRGYSSTKAASPIEVWRDWADDLTGQPLDCGHFLAEEQAEACAEAMGSFFRGD